MTSLRAIFLFAIVAVAAGQVSHIIASSERGISRTAVENSQKPRNPAAQEGVGEDTEDDDEPEESEYERERWQNSKDEFDVLMESFYDVDEAVNYEGHRSLYYREWYVMDRAEWKRRVRSYWDQPRDVDQGPSTGSSGSGDIDTDDRSSTGNSGLVSGDDDDDDDSSAGNSGSGDDDDDDDDDDDPSQGSSGSGSGDDDDDDDDDDDADDVDSNNGDGEDLPGGRSEENPTVVPTMSPAPTQNPSVSAAPTAFVPNCKVSLVTNAHARVEVGRAINLGWMEATYNRELKIIRCSRCAELEFEDCPSIECVDEGSCRDSSFVKTGGSEDPTSVHCKGKKSCLRSSLANIERVTCSGVDSCADTRIVESNELECVTEDSCRGLTFQ